MDTMDDQQIIDLVIDGETVLKRSDEIEHDRAVAVQDLLEENRFSPTGNHTGPYQLRLGLEDNRLSFEARDLSGQLVARFNLGLESFRSIIKDYAMICDSYYEALNTASRSKIETIDMSRRGLHNEGGERLKGLLGPHVDVDFATARRLFTLLFALHTQR